MPAKQWNLERLLSESSYWRSCILISAAHLNLFDWLGKREKTPRALAAHFGGSGAGWEIFLDALCGMGLLRKRGERYANTRVYEHYLRGGAATFLLPGYDAWDAWGGLASALSAGKRPRTQKPFFSDRQKAERLLHGLDHPCSRDCAISDQKPVVEPLPNVAGRGRRAWNLFHCFLSFLSSSAGNPG